MAGKEVATRTASTSIAITQPVAELIGEGLLSFTVESRVLRELGERLVKKPEVALIELVKNSYDADATWCLISHGESISVHDDGLGMTFEQFSNGWMRIGTSSKESTSVSKKFGRRITGEKGIGRFAVRFLGLALKLQTVADDVERKCRTLLTANFDWPSFDMDSDLGKIRVPYRIEKVGAETPLGTKLEITDLRAEADDIDLKKVRTGSISSLTPLKSMFLLIPEAKTQHSKRAKSNDPGFSLRIKQGDGTENDVGEEILKHYVLKANIHVEKNKLRLQVFKRDESKPYLEIVDSLPNKIGRLYADIRFYPHRKGTFANLPVAGRDAKSWIKENSGVAVFDREFRVQPYGSVSDDWLYLSADAASNRRDPRSAIALKHFPMSSEVRTSTSENWMLRLPASAQLLGIVQVQGRRNEESGESGELIASADREGFVENEAFEQLQDIVRGAIEAIAYVDRSVQFEVEAAEQRERLARLRKETKAAIREIQSNESISARDKARIVEVLSQTQELADQHDEVSKERERQLETMSLLGVVAGFMTHEFGVALEELEATQNELISLAKKLPKFEPTVTSFSNHIKKLREFVTYSSAYIQGSKIVPATPYPVKPRLAQVKRIFGQYADDRDIVVDIQVEADLLAPLVPASLYNGIALNLYTNALKAVTAKVGSQKGTIAFRAWNDERWHYLEVSDTGVGIPTALYKRVFDPLFTTTQSRSDPLGSGMGLGLALVKRGAEAFGGTAKVVEPPPEFATCVRVKLPLKSEA